MEQLSLDLQAAFPNEKGFGSSNLWYMKKWYLFYEEKLHQLVGELGIISEDFLHQAGGESIQHSAQTAFPKLFSYVPWKHHVEIITKCKTVEEAVFYLKLTVKESLSRQGLVNCLKANLFIEKGGAISNYKEHLPLPHAQLAQEITRGNYDFSFIQLPPEYCERDLEDALCK